MESLKYFLDTHIILWWLFDQPELSDKHRLLISDPNNQILVSPASAWEVAIKAKAGKLPLANHVAAEWILWMGKANFLSVPIQDHNAVFAGNLDWDHRDPFDRMICAQALLEGVQLLTADRLIMEKFPLIVA